MDAREVRDGSCALRSFIHVPGFMIEQLLQ